MSESFEGIGGRKRSLHLSAPRTNDEVPEEEVRESLSGKIRAIFNPFGGKARQKAEGEGEPAGNSGREKGSIDLYEGK